MYGSLVLSIAPHVVRGCLLAFLYGSAALLEAKLRAVIAAWHQHVVPRNASTNSQALFAATSHTRRSAPGYAVCAALHHTTNELEGNANPPYPSPHASVLRYLLHRQVCSGGGEGRFGAMVEGFSAVGHALQLLMGALWSAAVTARKWWQGLHCGCATGLPHEQFVKQCPTTTSSKHELHCERACNALSVMTWHRPFGLWLQLALITRFSRSCQLPGSCPRSPGH
jgi:hypothetical protein